MEQFTPGKAYGNAYQWLILVCFNPVERSFDQCSNTLAKEVFEHFKLGVMQQGLVREVMVATSSCLMGCQPDGVTVSLIDLSQQNNSRPTQFFNNVKPQDVSQLLNQLVQK